MKIDVNILAVGGISAYCESRNWKCRGCRYSIDKVTEDRPKYATCIFGNCPRDWDIKEGNNGKNQRENREATGTGYIAK